MPRRPSSARARTTDSSPSASTSNVTRDARGARDHRRNAAQLEARLRWNWDSPLIISPHSHTRLYFAAKRLFRSDDRGNSWRAVSPDLTRQIDRNKLEVMGKVWSVDAVAKNTSTSFYGNIVSLAESPKKEGLLYVGTDDGLVQVTEDGGATGARSRSSRASPSMTYVSDLDASQHDDDTVYAAFDNHKMGDFKPYVLKSTDRGKTWTSIAGDLPERGTRLRRSPRTTSTATCSSPAPSSASSSPSTAARSGSSSERPADDRGARPRDPAARERPRGGHLRPRLLHPRRLHAAARRVRTEADLEKDAILFPVKNDLDVHRGLARSACPARRSWARPTTPRRTRRTAPSSPTTSRRT